MAGLCPPQHDLRQRSGRRALTGGPITASRRRTVVASRPGSPRRARAARSGRLELDDAKLAPPVVPDGAVRRATVVSRLLGAAYTRHVAITAPPGYGKTIALAQWASRDARPFAWLTLDRRDDDPEVLVAYVAAALGRVTRVDPALSAPDGSEWRAAAARLGAALSDASQPLVLVLDDAHHLSSPEALEVLAVLADHVPRSSQLVLCGRHLAAPVARRRAAQELFELHASDLALTRREAEGVVQAAGARPSDPELDALYEGCEGWAAGMYLAALSRRGSSPAASAAQPRVSGTEPFLAEYLRDELLSHLSPRDVRFLIRSSVLQPMTASLCDAALGGRDAARTLARLERANVFVTRTDDAVPTYRYHGLFRDLLRNELDRLEPGRSWKVARRAAVWCSVNGRCEQAVDYAFASGQVELGARLAGALPSAPSGGRGEFALERWLGQLGEATLLDRYPLLAVHGAWLHALRGRAAAATRWAEAVDRAPLAGPAPDGSPSMEAWAEVLRGAMCRDGAANVRGHAERALAGLAPLSPSRPLALVVLAAGHWLAGEDDDALVVLDDAVESAASEGTTDVSLVALSQRALLRMGRGDHGGAGHDVREAQGLLAGASDPEYLEPVVLHAAAARLALLRGSSRDARASLEAAERLRPLLTHALPWFAVGVQLELARARLALGDAAAARSLLADVAAIERRRPDLGVLGPRAHGLRRDAELLAAASGDGRASSLTAAELRLLPLLTTHLTFREIGQELFVTRNTVKTQAISLYRKLGSSSRSDAIRRATELGLLSPTTSAEGRVTPTG